ncbi:DNA polymerase, partial [Pseudoalteromonas sp.]|uniref:DNA polymerase n=1 Tax=Pseudoalteromonas sp. TaxID=53249 RepID=UPI00261DF263
MCKSYKPPDHDFCFFIIYEPKIGPDPEEVNDSLLPNGKNNAQVYYFNLETKFVTNAQKDRVELVPNLCCIEKESGEAVEFYGNDSMRQFMEWLLGEEVDGWRIVYAHNFAGFNAYPVLEYFFSRAMLPQFLFRGQKCLQIVYKPCKLIFRCSLNFFPFPLVDFTKAFGLNCSKGHLPFLLNTDESQNYVGEFPDLELFEPNSFTSAKAAKLKEWWTQKRQKYIEKGKQYNFLD